MKIKILFMLLALCNSCVFAQTNVGIGTTTPSEKLDVNGNINVRGTVKVNGVAGQSNQVLMTNSSGNLAWTDNSQFKNFIGFINPGNGQTWIVPTGVTKILIEAWGGGGSGGLNGGGGGGGYSQAVFVVIPGEIITVDVANFSLLGASGANSSVSRAGLIATASGGSSAGAQPGEGGDYYASASIPAFGFSGETSHVTREKYEHYASNNFLKSTNFGDGGSGANTSNTGGRGGSLSIDIAVSPYPSKVYDGTGGVSPGGGGGGSDVSGGFGGGKGMVIIRY